jgi:hypothetical protein
MSKKSDIRFVRVAFPLDIYATIKKLAERELRSVSKEVLFLADIGAQVIIAQDQENQEPVPEEEPPQDAIGFKVDNPEDEENEEEEPEEDKKKSKKKSVRK